VTSMFKSPLLISSLSLSFLAACGKPAPAPEPTEPQSVQSAPAKAVARLSIHNPSDFLRSQEPIYLAAADLGLAETEVQNSGFIATDSKGQLPSQWIDRNADGEKDTLLISPTLSAGETLDLQITAGTATEQPKQTQAEISQKTGGQWQDKKYVGGSFENVSSLTPPPQYTDHSEFIRYEGPGIESDKVAYRIYLDWRNGFDIFGNKTGKPILDQIGQDGYSSYHEMLPWGTDVLKVGKAVGAGGFGYWDGSKVERVSKLDGHTVTIIENGPLYSAMTIDYKNWQIAGKTLDVKAHLSMTAGSRLLHNRLTLSQPLDNLALGIVKLPDTQLLTGTLESSGHTYTYLATYGKQSLDGSNLGMAILFKRGKLEQLTTDEHNHVAVMNVSGQHLEYYLLGAWQHELNGISNEQQFVEYLQQEVERLTLQPRLRLKTELTKAQTSQPLTSERALYWSQQLANSELKRQAGQHYWGGWDTERDRPVSFEYTTGLLVQAYDDLNKYAPNPAYQAVISKMADSFVAADGTIHSYDASKFNIDSINSGNALLRVYEQTKEPKYQLAVQALREQLKHHPKTSNGAFWHKKIYPHQLWLDGVYMGMPFLAYYSSLFEQGASLEQALHEFVVTREQLRDDKTGLYFHAWDESKQMDWADKETGRSAYFWGRAIGWLGMALVDVLDYIPADNTELRQPLLTMVTELAADLARYQDAESGVWYQIMDKAGERGNYLESSGSSMFVYFYAKAINKGYLPKEQYLEISKKAWQGLLDEFVLVHPDGSISLTNMVQVAGLGAGRDGSYHYYMSEPIYRNDSKGTGPFIMAGVQMAQLLKD